MTIWVHCGIHQHSVFEWWTIKIMGDSDCLMACLCIFDLVNNLNAKSDDY